MFFHQSAGQISPTIKVPNKYFENRIKFKYLGMTVTVQQNYIHEEVKSTLNLGNASCSSVQNLSFLSIN
jgi:hypothetical protein